VSGHLQSALGLVAIPGIAWLLSENRRAVSWRFTAIGLAVQVALAVLFLKVAGLREVFVAVNHVVAALQRASEAGSGFVFGFLGGGPLPYEEVAGASSVIFAFRFLPLIMLMSALAALLTHWRILPRIVQGFAWLFARTLRIGGAVAVAAAANVFMGMVEAPLLVRPYLEKMTRSEVFVVMCTGMSTIAGTVLVLYATMLRGVLANPAGHLLVASLISVPAAVVVARLMVPETGLPTPGTLTDVEPAHGAMDALAQGTRRGLDLFLNILAMLFVFVALVQLVDLAVGALPPVGGAPLSLSRILGWVFAPVAWLLGVSTDEAATVGSLLGSKTVLNELIAYAQLAALPDGTLSERSTLITTYALCGFANFGSLGILIGGFSVLAPARRAEINALGLRSIVAGTLATCLTGATVGLLF
jgi:concentrative nucleoside transporter, CNT family